MSTQSPAQTTADTVGRGSTRAARRAPLYDFLKARHPRDVVLEGDSWLRLDRNRSVVTSKGRSGYKNFATDESGNAVDCLVNYLDYSFQEAVIALCDYMDIPTDLPAGTINLKDLMDYEPPDESTGTAPGASVSRSPAGQISLPSGTPGTSRRPPEAAPKPFAPPPPVQGPYARLFAYLTQQRGIPAGLVQELVDRKLLYQDARHGNAVFIDADRTYAELRGTLSGKPFHGMVPGSATAGFWSFKPLGPQSVPTGAFICEAAIDAISLHLLRQRFFLPDGDNPMYCSIGGVANQQRIDRIKAVMDAMGLPTTLAVDNDEAGEKCRQRNLGCFTYVPRGSRRSPQRQDHLSPLQAGADGQVHREDGAPLRPRYRPSPGENQR